MSNLKQAEQMVLSAILKEPEKLYGFSERDFEIYGSVFVNFRKTAETGVNLNTRAVSIIQNCGHTAMEAAEIITAYKGEKAFLSQAKYQLKQRTVKKLLGSINDDNFDRTLNLIQKERSLIDAEYIEKPAPLFQEYITELDKRAGRKKINYSLPTLNRITGGIKNGEMTIIAARPAVGKTMFALQEALNVAEQGFKVLYFSLEMSREQMTERMIKKYTSISSESLESGKLNHDDWNVLSLLISRMDETEKNLLIFDNISELGRIKDCTDQFKPDVVIIDQLSQIRTGEYEKSIRERFTTVTRSLKAYALEKDIPVLLLAQINRSTENEAPTLINLKESGSIEEDADNVIMLHRKMYPDDENGVMMLSNEMVIILGKHRNGEVINYPACVIGSKYTIIEKEE